LTQNIRDWAGTLPPNSQTQWKCCSELLSKSFRLGKKGQFLKLFLLQNLII
jgi:hypothetical protein